MPGSTPSVEHPQPTLRTLWGTPPNPGPVQSKPFDNGVLNLDGYHILVSAGQSNTHLGHGTIPQDFVAHPRVFQLGRHAASNLQLLPAKEPLQHWTSNGSSIGHAKTFAERYIQTLAPDQKVLIIPAGCSGTGLGAGHWVTGGLFYEDLIYRVGYALQQFPDSRVVGVLWHQGENDVFNTSYHADLVEMIPEMRLRFGGGTNIYERLPFLLGGLSDAWLAANYQFQATEDIIASIPFLVTNTAFVSSDGLGFNQPPGYGNDIIHINAAGQREFGHRYFERFDDAQNNTF